MAEQALILRSKDLDDKQALLNRIANQVAQAQQTYTQRHHQLQRMYIGETRAGHGLPLAGDIADVSPLKGPFQTGCRKLRGKLNQDLALVKTVNTNKSWRAL